MKILVTGGSGFIGSNLVRLLIEEKGCEVINLDKLTYAGNAESLADLEDHPNYHFEQIDLASPEAMSGKVKMCEGEKVEEGEPGVRESEDFEPSHLNTLKPSHASNAGSPSDKSSPPFQGGVPGGRGGSDSSSSDHILGRSNLDTLKPSHTCENSLLALFHKHQPDAVMHLAAESHVDRSIDGPGEFIQTNIVGTFNLLQAALAYWKGLPENSDQKTEDRGQGGEEFDKPRETKSFTRQLSKETFRFLHVSTDEVYGSLAPDAPGFSETTPYDPHSPYSASKAASDHLARAWADTYGLPVLVTNCSNNYGPYQFPEKLIPVVILKCLRGEPIPVYGKGENIRDWLYVKDHAEALYTVVTKGRVGETYNIGGNNEQTNLDLIKKLCVILEEEIKSSGVLQPPSGSEPSNLSTSTPTHASKAGPPPSNSPTDSPPSQGGVPAGRGGSRTHQSPVSTHNSVSYESLITFVTDRPGHDLRYAIDSTKIRDELGWAPKEDFESGFRKTVQWYLENQDWWQRILDGSYQLERLGKS